MFDLYPRSKIFLNFLGLATFSSLLLKFLSLLLAVLFVFLPSTVSKHGSRCLWPPLNFNVFAFAPLLSEAGADEGWEHSNRKRPFNPSCNK
jgi:hypothetical protein